MIGVSQLMVNAGEIYQRLGYPLKEGQCVTRLLDQAIYELRQLKCEHVCFNHPRFMREVFVRDNEEEEELRGLEEEESEESVAVESWPRTWKVQKCIELLFSCKRSMMLEQLSFLIQRVRMTAFIGEARINHYRSPIVNKDKIVSPLEGPDISINSQPSYIESGIACLSL